MKPSPDIEDRMRGMVDALQRGDVSAIERLTSRETGVVAIGTDPAEYSREFDEIMRLMHESTPDAGPQIHVHLDTVHAYEEGDVGWVDGTGRFEHDGESVQVRMTAVLRREDGEWHAIQSHASIGVPNANMFDSTFQTTTTAT